MVKAELNYNPYLNKTLIYFNGREPRVNSVVEKYRNMLLQTWISELPQIFHDEMNGYDFELEFSGTKLDYEEVKNSFRKAGVSEEAVLISYKNELDGRREKMKAIHDLIIWLDENRNERFDHNRFCKEEKSLSDEIYTVIVLGKEQYSFDSTDYMADLSVEYVSGTDELNNTDLNNTPILIDITTSTISRLQNILQALSARKEINKDQLFFSIDQSLDWDKTIRILNDLGMDDPQAVKPGELKEIYNYLEVYPVSDYIYGVLKLLRSKADEVRQSLDHDKQVNASTNKKIYEDLEKIDRRIDRLKESLSMFVNRDNIPQPETWKDIGQELFDHIRDWKKRKTKITKDEEAIKRALEFNLDTHQKYSEFQRDIKGDVLRYCLYIQKKYREWYRKAGVDEGFSPKETGMEIKELPELPGMTEELLLEKTEVHVENREDFLGKFLKVGSERSDQSSIEVTYYYQDWREHVLEKVRPLFKETVDIYYAEILEFEKELAASYKKQLESLIIDQKKEKEATALQLSEEEKRIQKDEEWLTVFCDQLDVIERG